MLSALLLTACNGDAGYDNVSPTPPAPPSTISVSGSVGDGPIVNATVTARDANGVVVATATSDTRAKYTMSLPSTTLFPVAISSTGGTDLVTNAAPTFPLTSALLTDSQAIANVTPITTLTVHAAQCRAGTISVSSMNAAASAIADQFSTGIDANLIPNAISTTISISNVAEMVKGNQVAAEVFQRIETALRASGRTINQDQVIRAIGCDLSDGVLDGAGATGTDEQVSAVATIVASTVLSEALKNELLVGNTPANGRLDAAIARVSPDAPANEDMDSVLITPEVVRNAREAIVASTAINPDIELIMLAQQLEAVTTTTDAQTLKAFYTPEVEASLTTLQGQTANLTIESARKVNRGRRSRTPPTMTVTADRTAVSRGETVQFTWTSSNTTACSVSGAMSAALPVQGVASSNPINQNSSFLFTCVGGGGSAEQRINVTASSAAPSVNLTASPVTIAAGGSTTLSWTSSNADSCSASGGWAGTQAASGTQTFNNITSSQTFVLTCTGSGGSATGSATVAVASAPVVNITASPTAIASGGSTTLTWSTANASACTASGGWSGSKLTSGNQLVSSITGNQTFTLTCTGTGGSATASASVVVAGAPSVTLTASPASIASGGSATLTWSSTNASACTASGGWSGSKAVSGNQPVTNIASTQTFTLTCNGTGGTSNATATVTVAPQPTVTLTASPATIASGGSTTLTWSSTNASACTASGGWSGGKAASGNQSVTNITSAQTFTLTCTGTGGSANASASVTIAAAPTVTLSASPTTIASGGSTTLTWSSTNASACTASGGWSGGKAASGNQSVTNITGAQTFTLTCTGTGGSANASASVTVAAAPTVTLSASPATIASGGSTTLTWSSTNASACTASGGWSGSKAVSGNQSVTNITSSQTFTLTCTGTGGSANASASVTVAGAPSVTLTASPTTIASGGSTTLTWSSTNASACTASGGWSGSKAVSGNQSVTNITSAQTFTLTCAGTGGSANASASVTVAAAPTVTLSASPAIIASGGSATLTWSSTNASACTASGGWSGSKAASGSQDIANITSAQTFTLTCTGGGGSATASATVSIGSTPTLTFSSSAASVNLAGSVTLNWSSTNASSCTAAGAWTGSKAVSGSEALTNITANGTYELTCSGLGGSVTRQVTVTIATPTVTLTANPTQVAAGGSVTLSWSATNATSCIAAGSNWTGEKGPGPDSQTRTVSATTTYTLTCSGPGGSLARSVTITVLSNPTVNLSLSSSSVASGSTVTINWSSSNATACTATSADTGFTGTVALSGTRTSTPITATRTYTLQCTNSIGSAIASSTVTVQSTGAGTLVSWTAPTTMTDGSPITQLTGYKVYFGTSPRQYSQVLNVNDPFATSGTLTLGTGTWYVAVTALAEVTDSSGTQVRESDYSAEVSTTIN